MSTTPVPIRSPFFDGAGNEKGPRLVASLGNLGRDWALFFEGLRAGASGVTGGGASALVLRQLLTHGGTVTIIPPTATADGQLLVVLAKQPVNHDGKIAWTPGAGGFSADTPTAINTAVGNSLARIEFMWGATENLWLFLRMNAGGVP